MEVSREAGVIYVLSSRQLRMQGRSVGGLHVRTNAWFVLRSQ